jgi:ATP/maltotriose-dependent transcriptional regulator MalT/DNA-binding SARP family transcriptional activator
VTDGAVVVTRGRLTERLHAAVTHRLTVIVADAGFGKTELLEQWLAARHTDAAVLVRPAQRDLTGIVAGLAGALRDHAPDDAARLALVASGRPSEPEAMAGMICAALAGLPVLHVLLVLDNAHLLSEPTQRFLEALVRQSPATLHVLLLTRHELSFGVDRLADPVQRFDGTDLGFDDAEMSQLMTRVVGHDEHAPAVRAFLGRWPAAVRMAAEKLAQVPPDRRTAELLRLKTHGERGLLELAQEVLDAEPPRNRRLAQVVAVFDGFTAELAEALGCESAQQTIDELFSRGILVKESVEGVPYYNFPRLLRDFVRARLPIDPEERPGLIRAAGAWFQEHGYPEGALRCAIDLHDSGWAADVLRAHGRTLLDQGRDGRVEQGLAVVAPEDRDPDLDEVEGALHDARGNHVRALELYDRATLRRGYASPWLAYRTGFLHYFRGNLDEALAALTSARPDAGSAEESVLKAWQATVLWAQGEPEQAQLLASQALELAQRLQDPRALAAAHTIVAMLHAHRGERGDSREHYDMALHNAERSGDVMQVVRIRNNRAAALLEESELAAALPELEVAIELAQATGLTFYLSAALTNRGEVRFHQGQYDAAMADLEKARELDRDAGITSSATRIYLGHVYRHRGYANAARVAYEQVLAAGRSTGDATLVVPALCGLAQLLAETDPALARELVDEALGYDAGVNAVVAITAAGWVAHLQGRSEDAARYAEQARAEAAARHDRLGLAEALHLLAVSDPVLGGEDPRLEEAARLLDEVGAPVWRARVRLEQARRMPQERALEVVDEVTRLASALGARNLADRAAALARDLDAGDRVPHVEVITLGGFRVRRSGKALGLSDWSEDSAPGLLKRLTSTPSLTWTRTALQRSLWPGMALEQSQPLLDKAIDQLRSTLDPARELGLEQFVVARGDSVSLQSVEVDVHAFLAESASGEHDLLRRAEARYSGDYLEEHPGERWTLTLREEARARYVEVARALAATAVRDGEFDAAARYSRRILERDPYDEGAHLSLVAALASSGRDQEARSCYATYTTRFDELGLEAVPWALVNKTVAVVP